MKLKIAFYILGFSLLAGCSPKSEKTSIDVPANVKDAFNKLYSNATNVQWSKENDSEYEAEYTIGSVKKSSNFDQSGKWLVTETVIKSSDLPATVQSALSNEYSGYSIEEAEVAEMADGSTFYEIELEKGETAIELQIAPDGKVLKKEELEEEEDEDEKD